MYPDEMLSTYPKQGLDMEDDAPSLNQYEKQFFLDQLETLGLGHKSIHYHKIWAVHEGKKFQNRIKDYGTYTYSGMGSAKGKTQVYIGPNQKVDVSDLYREVGPRGNVVGKSVSGLKYKGSYK